MRQDSCRDCGAVLAPEDRFCRSCGASVGGAALADDARETLYRHLFEHAAEALALVDAENTITRVNHKFAQLAGLDRSAIEGLRRIEEFVLPGHKVRLV